MLIVPGRRPGVGRFYRDFSCTVPHKFRQGCIEFLLILSVLEGRALVGCIGILVVPHKLHRDFSCTAQISFRTNGIHSIRLRTTIKAGIFPFTFSIFFRETTFLESNAGGPPTGGSHRAGLVVSKKKKNLRFWTKIRDFAAHFSFEN